MFCILLAGILLPKGLGTSLCLILHVHLPHWTNLPWHRFYFLREAGHLVSRHGSCRQLLFEQIFYVQAYFEYIMGQQKLFYVLPWNLRVILNWDVPSDFSYNKHSNKSRNFVIFQFVSSLWQCQTFHPNVVIKVPESHEFGY